MIHLFTLANLASFVSLAAMEIVLGIDNIVFVAILSQRVAAKSRHRVRQLGIGLALILRLGLLFTLSWIMRLTQPLFSVFAFDVSGRHLILLGGGLFLILKATHEIHRKIEGTDEEAGEAGGKPAAFVSTLLQILLLDVVFSLDSVITAVGMAPHLSIMIAAMVTAVGIMLLFADSVSDFIHRHPGMKILALSFLLLIGVLLVAEAFDQHIEKTYVYFAMAFAFLVEVLNIRMRKRAAAKRKASR